MGVGSVQLLPSKCRMVPFNPLTHTLLALEAQIPHRFWVVGTVPRPKLVTVSSAVAEKPLYTALIEACPAALPVALPVPSIEAMPTPIRSVTLHIATAL